MDIKWDAIQKVMESDIEYEAFRSSVREFMAVHGMGVHTFASQAGLKWKPVAALVSKEPNKSRFETIAKVMKFMEGYRA